MDSSYPYKDVLLTSEPSSRAFDLTCGYAVDVYDCYLDLRFSSDPVIVFLTNRNTFIRVNFFRWSVLVEKQIW